MTQWGSNSQPKDDPKMSILSEQIDAPATIKVGLALQMALITKREVRRHFLKTSHGNVFVME